MNLYLKMTYQKKKKKKKKKRGGGGWEEVFFSHLKESEILPQMTNIYHEKHESLTQSRFTIINYYV